MHNYRVRRVDPESLAVNQRIVSQHMDSEHYVRWIDPQLIQIDTPNSGAGLPSRGLYGFRSHWLSLPDAGTPTVVWGLEVPEQWKNGVIQTTLFYTGDVSTADAISLRLRAGLIKVGTNLSNHGFVTDPGFVSLAGPGTAHLETRHVFVATVPITQEHHRLTWLLNRAVADAYTGAVRITRVRHRYIPAQHMAGGKAVP